MSWKPFSIFAFALLMVSPVLACGWWGDGEVALDIDAPAPKNPEGQLLDQSLSLRSAKLPGEMGYGIALPDPGQAVPYLLTTHGRPVNRIGELKTYGYRTVIDLGTPEKTARLHKAETEDVGMVYFNIPIEGDMPSPQQVQRFRELVVSSGNNPTLVYAPRAALLGAMWTAYRISFGTPLSFALSEGRALGMTPDQEGLFLKRSR